MAKSRAQQAAIAISMKKAGKIPKGYHKMPDGTIMKDSAHKKTKPLTKAEDGMIVKNKRVINRYSSSGTRNDGTSFKAKTKTVWDNKGTKENPYLTNQRSKMKISQTDESGKTTTTVRKVNSDGESKTRKAIIPVRKTGGMIKSKKKR